MTGCAMWLAGIKCRLYNVKNSPETTPGPCYMPVRNAYYLSTSSIFSIISSSLSRNLISTRLEASMFTWSVGFP